MRRIVDSTSSHPALAKRYPGTSPQPRPHPLILLRQLWVGFSPPPQAALADWQGQRLRFGSPLPPTAWSRRVQKSPHSFTSRAEALTLVGLLSLAAPASTRAANLVYIHDFKGGTDGANPTYGLVIGPHGAVYGTTAATIFRLAQAKNGKWLEKPIFAPGMASLIGTPTALYGLTQAGFTMLTPPAKGEKTWTQTTLYSFPTGNGAAIPSTLAIAPDGSFAGTSPEGGGATACGSDNGVPTGCGRSSASPNPAEPGLQQFCTPSRAARMAPCRSPRRPSTPPAISS